MGELQLFLNVLTEVMVIMTILTGRAGAERIPSKLEGTINNEYNPIYDRCLDIKSRVESLVASLTLEEKLGLLVNTASGVPRLGIPSYQWQNEGLHGVAHSPGVSFNGPIHSATSFPQPILTASSFNQTLFNEIGKAISTEARAFYNVGQGGLTYWTPNINIFRDPRWGRGQETPGEDPHLTSVYAEYFVRGLQEPDNYAGNSSSPAPIKLKLSACCKHFTAYDLEAWNGIERYGFNAVVTQQDLDDTYNPPFKSCIQKGRASGLMCSYNAVNGIPSCADPNLSTIVRDEWGFDGYVVSDCDAVQTIYANQKYADPEHAVAVALKAGLDLNCGDTFSNFSGGAYNKHLITEGEVDVALTHSLTVQFRLGLFDRQPSMDDKYGALGKADVCSKEHQRLALEAALQGIVLLKNIDHNILPLSSNSIRTLAVIGPNANESLNTMVGNYAGDPCKYVTPLQGLRDYLPGTTIQYVAGCHETACESADFIADTIEARSAAATADATILIMGLGQIQETEALDRTTLLLPGQQQQLIMSVAAYAKGPVVLVVMSGGPVDIKFARDAESIGGIFWIGYPGQAGGQALAQIIFGDRNPGGKLSMTWYPEAFTSWPMTTMDMRPDPASGYPGRTHRFYTGETIYKFGDGLSYSTFKHSYSCKSVRREPLAALVAPSSAQLSCYEDATTCTDDTKEQNYCHELEFTTELTVSNTHWRRGSEVILLYVSPPNAGKGGIPLKQLIGFQRVSIAGNESLIVPFSLKPCKHFVTTGSDGIRELHQGVHTLSSNGGVQFDIEFRSVT